MQSDPSSDKTAIRAADDSSASADAVIRPAVAAEPPVSSGRVVLTVGEALSTAPDDKTVITNRPHLGDAPPPILATPQTIGEILIGKTLDHYELVEFVGGGGMGAVFRANDTRLGRTVAVKILSRDQSDEETIRRFRNEAQSAARLDHPNIARVFFVGESSGWNYIVFEFIEGINLRDLVDERGPLAVEDALNYTLQITEALAHSSSRDVVHRDIKPSNVLVTAEGQAKLVDMGLARLHQVESSSDDLTASGVTLGTFDYISPEQARDPRVADVRSDIYSLGCTLFYLLTGQPPFPEGTALQKLLRHNDEERPDVRQLRPDLPASVAALISRMLAKRPSQRFQSPADLTASILLIGQELGLTLITQRGAAVLPVASASSQWRQTAWQIAGAVALLAAAVIVLDSFLTAGTRSLEPRPQPKLLAAAVSSPANVAPPNERINIVAEPSVVRPAAGSAQTLPVSENGDTPPASSGANDAPGAAAAIAAAGVGAKSAPDSTAEIGSDPATEVSPALQESAIGPPPVIAAVETSPVVAILGGGGEVAGSLAAPPLPRKINRLIVGAPAALAAPDAEYFSSLAAAVRRASELNLSEVELHFTGPREESPLEVASSRLTLKAGTGFHPVIVFRPQLEGLDAVREMIRLAGGSTSRLAIQGVELRLELPVDPSYGWSLLAMYSGQALELADCVLTVQNVDERHTQVAMIEVRARRPVETMTMAQPQPSMASPTRISLDRCIARGAASVIGMNEETPLDIRWNQGLIVTPWHFIATGGSTSVPTRFEDISISLVHVTAICRQGLYQVMRRPGTGYQLALDVDAQNCILMTDQAEPLFDFVGVSDVAESDLQHAGQGNLYPNPDAVFLRLRGHSAGPPTEYALKKIGLIWSKERSPQTGDPWRPALDLSLPPHLRDKNDFEIPSAMPIDAGFDPEQLPEIIPPIAATPAVAAPVNVPAASPAPEAPPAAESDLPFSD